MGSEQELMKNSMRGPNELVVFFKAWDKISYAMLSHETPWKCYLSLVFSSIHTRLKARVHTENTSDA